MAATEKSSCSKCRILERRVAQLEGLVRQLQEENARLAEAIARLKKDSSTSSKPPSSDIVKPPSSPPPRGGKHKRGGQPGHPGITRIPFAPEQIDRTVPLTPKLCPDCLESLEDQPIASTQTFQQAELPTRRVTITEYHRHGKSCPCCRRIIYAPWPEGVAPHTLFGPQIQALVAYLKGELHGSFEAIRGFFRDILALPVSRGTLAATINRVSQSLSIPYQEVARQMPMEPLVHADETGARDTGHWIWHFGSRRLLYFVIRPSRGSPVVQEVLGDEYQGILVHDFFSAYMKYGAKRRQFCLAHLIRDIKFLTTLPNKREQRWGEKVLADFRCLFRLYHRRGQWTERRYRRRMYKYMKRIRQQCWNPSGLPHNAYNLAKRIRQHFADLFRFVDDPSVPPTNNAAERGLRPVVIDRRVTLGTKSEAGRRWAERIWTVLGTCRLQGQSPWTFLLNAIHAHYFNRPVPSLLPNPA